MSNNKQLVSARNLLMDAEVHLFKAHFRASAQYHNSPEGHAAHILNALQRAVQAEIELAHQAGEESHAKG